MKYLAIYAATVLGTTLFGAEPSAFGAGDLNSQNPYGLTKSEKVILENKKAAQEIKSKSLKNADSIEGLRESVEGLRSVFEGTNQSFADYRSKISQVEAILDEHKGADQKLQMQIDDLKAQFETFSQTVEGNFENIKKIMSELSSLVDSINNSYVSKVKYQEDITMILQKLNTMATVQAKSSYEDISGADLLAKAVETFRKNDYDAARGMFLTLIEKKYKPARSNYYLGEISYYQKKYQDAIARYKTSIGLYDKASYTPTLLLHTALSFQYLGDKENAGKFFDVLVANYPKSNEASLVDKYKK
jgi:TolA-binding protein